MPRTNGKKDLPRLVPGGAAKAREQRVVNLPSLGVSVLIEAPSFGAWQEVMQLNLPAEQTDLALAALAMVEPQVTVAQLKEMVREWEFRDWMVLDQELTDLMGLSEGALRAAREAFRGPGE